MSVDATQSKNFSPFRPSGFALDQLSIFAFLIAGQALVHQETFRYWFYSLHPIGWLLTFALIGLALRPWSLLLMITALILNVVYSASILPYVVNHLVFEDLFYITLLLGIGWVLWKRWRAGELSMATFNSPDTRNEIYKTVAPVVRLELILLYFFVTLAKLNYDFFDPVVSCGALMFRDLLPPSIDPGLPVVGLMSTASLWITILAEGGLPILLLFKRTRPLAIMIGLLFHFALGFHPHLGVYSFSAMMYMLYFVFTGDGFTETLNAQLNQVASALRNPENMRRVKVIAGALVGLLVLAGVIVVGALALNFEIPNEIEEFVGPALWFTWTLTILPIYLITLWRTPAEKRAENTPIFVNYGLLWIMPIVILMNGLFPYFGYKTETSFAMFSNLRTEEDNTNHLFLPTSLQFGDYQRDLVEITSTDHEGFQYYIDGHMLLTRFEFERLLTELDDFAVTCDCYGTTLEISKQNGVLSGFDQEMTYQPLLGRFFTFRPISQEEQMPCTH